MAVPQDRREGQREARKGGRPHALRPLCPPAPERGQEGWPPTCAEASVSTSWPGCRMQSGLHPQDTGDRGDWTLPKGGGGSWSGTAPSGGPGLGGCWPCWALSGGHFWGLGHHGGMLVFAQAFRGKGRSCRWTAQAWAQQHQLQTQSCHHVSMTASPQGPRRC